MAPLFSEHLKAALESLLFVAGRPLNLKTLAQATGASESDIEELIQEIRDDYDRGRRGMQVVAIAGGFQMVTRPEFAPCIERLFQPEAQVLSRAAIETLSIIAYKQPVTRLEIEAIRGVKVEGVLSGLLEKGLIEELGRREGPGRPALYGTSRAFLEHFCLKDLSELPPLPALPTDDGHQPE